MKAGQTDIDVGTKIEVLAIASDDPDDAVGVVGTVGEITHPFGDLPNTIAGVWVQQRGSKRVGVIFPINRIGLCRGDTVAIVETGETITL